MKDVSVDMTKKKKRKKRRDICFYDSNDFTVVLSPLVSIYIAEPNKQAQAVNVDVPQTYGALSEKPWLGSPIAEQVKLFSVSLWGRSVEKEGGGAKGPLNERLTLSYKCDVVLCIPSF